MNDTDKIKSRAVKDFEVKFKSDYANSGLMEVYKRDLLERYKVFLRETLDKVAEAAVDEYTLKDTAEGDKALFNAGKQAARQEIMEKLENSDELSHSTIYKFVRSLLDHLTERCEHGVLDAEDCFKCAPPVEGKCCEYHNKLCNNMTSCCPSCHKRVEPTREHTAFIVEPNE